MKALSSEMPLVRSLKTAQVQGGWRRAGYPSVGWVKAYWAVRRKERPSQPTQQMDGFQRPAKAGGVWQSFRPPSRP